MVLVITVFLIFVMAILALAQVGFGELLKFVRALFLFSRACFRERRVVGLIGRGVMRRRILRRAFAAAFWSVPSYLRRDYRQAGRRIAPLVRHVENQLGQMSAKQKRALMVSPDTQELIASIFSHQMRCFMLGGAIEEAMITLIRARQIIGVERLAAFPEIDFKAAHLVKAGLAAGKLIDGSGLSALLINPTDASATRLSPEEKPASLHQRRRLNDFGRIRKPATERRGVVIPLRRPDLSTSQSGTPGEFPNN